MTKSLQERQEFATEHFGFEVRMLVATFNCQSEILSDTALTCPNVVANALYESFMVHARLLDDFLRNRGHDSDAKASDYITVTTWKLPCTKPDWHRIVDKRIVHLDWSREPQSGENIGEILAELRTDLLGFYAALPADRQVWFEVIPEAFHVEEGAA